MITQIIKGVKSYKSFKFPVYKGTVNVDPIEEDFYLSLDKMFHEDQPFYLCTEREFQRLFSIYYFQVYYQGSV